MAKNALTYDPAFIETIASLVGINDQVHISKSDTGVNIKNNDEAEVIMYEINAPSSMCDFVGDSLSFIRFNKFVQYYNNYCSKDKTPILETDNDKQTKEAIYIHIKSPVIASEIKHKLTSADLITKSCFEEGIDAGDKDADVDFTEAQFAQIKKMISLVDATNISFSVNQDICRIKLFNPKSPDVFEQDYVMNNTCDSAFSVTLPINGFIRIPNAAYNMGIDEEGMLHLHQTRDDKLDLDIYLPFDA